MALTKIIGQGIGTLGSGAEADAKIVFDGNAQDFYIGLDDSSDILAIGNGTDLGASRAIIVDANGIIRTSQQPAFSASPSANLENFAINQYNNVNFDSERFDRNADYNAGGSPSTFVAPVTGIYQLNFHLYILSVDTAATWFQFSILTSNKEYTSILDPNFSGDLGYYPMNLSVAADMDANDSAYVRVYQLGGSAQMDVAGNSSFSGYLIG